MPALPGSSTSTILYNFFSGSGDVNSFVMLIFKGICFCLTCYNGSSPAEIYVLAEELLLLVVS